jgi:hypothetical protein
MVVGVDKTDVFQINIKLTLGDTGVYSIAKQNVSILKGGGGTPVQITIPGLTKGGGSNNQFVIPKKNNRKTRQIYNKTISNRNKIFDS